jgi:eukaryotic-like serine/threonine-protein kinase
MIPYVARMPPTRSLSGTSGGTRDRLVGRVLGRRYRVLSRLGEGGMGAVYLCEHAVLGRRYAVKVLRPALADDPELVERFRNEAIAASRAGGENVVDVLDFGTEDDGAHYYVMEALEGRSLGALIVEDGPLEVPRALALLDQLCRALGAAHARGVVHRDVKPDNVFVERRRDGAERAKVIDFGISQLAPEAGKERLTRAGEIIGTPEYMAPEQAAGDPIDHRVDVYALGVLAYEMLTGALPIVAHTPIATLVAQQTRTPEPPSRRRPELGAALDALVLRALAKRPEDRPASMEVFADAIAELRCGFASPVLPAPVRSPSPPRAETVALVAPPRVRRRGRTALGLALVALCAAAAATSWLRSRATAPVTPPVASSPASETISSTSVHPERAAEAEAAAPSAKTTSCAAVHPGRSAGGKATATSRGAPRSDPHLDDPYAAGGLKPDPFR